MIQQEGIHQTVGIAAIVVVAVISTVRWIAVPKRGQTNAETETNEWIIRPACEWLKKVVVPKHVNQYKDRVNG